MTDESKALVERQLASLELSIYDKSGVIAEFEEMFSAMHGMKYGLVTSSGTAALHSAYYALGIGLGDEVICPSYTFFATATPLFQLGARPVLVDVKPDGTFDTAAAESAISPRTKAVVVTHMWGVPCDMERVSLFCRTHGLLLVEDCSHAHGAKVSGRYVGTYSDVAIWSLQTKKIIAAGEGGILLTNDRETYDRAQILGHFNKRALNEADPSGPMYPYAGTGTGLKYRAHPLGIAFALGQLPYLERWIEAKQAYAERIRDLLCRIPGLKVLNVSDMERRLAYYALTFVLEGGADATREELVRSFHGDGFHDVDIPASTVGLHTLHMFRHPVSPVTIYESDCVGSRAYKNTDFLSRNVIKVSVPCGHDEAGDEHFMQSLGRSVDNFINQLGKA